MGWRDVTDRRHADGSLSGRNTTLTDGGWEVDYIDDIPAYSTDIAAAWMVVERITRPPETMEEAERAANTRFGFWWRDANLWAYSGSEAPHAICLAALRAVGWTEEGGDAT